MVVWVAGDAAVDARVDAEVEPGSEDAVDVGGEAGAKDIRKSAWSALQTQGAMPRSMAARPPPCNVHTFIHGTDM